MPVASVMEVMMKRGMKSVFYHSMKIMEFKNVKPTYFQNNSGGQYFHSIKKPRTKPGFFLEGSTNIV